MFDAFIDGLFLVLQWKAFSLMLVGMGLGFCVGLLPGIGGAATLALMIPFIFKMSPAEAFAFLLGMHSVAATTGDITSVLFGVPGEAISAATVVDGYPMAKKGEAGRALGAALMSSLLGALIGAVALALAIPVVRPLVLTFGSPELFMLSVIGISCITSLSGAGARGQIKGFAMGLLGLLVSTIGQERQSGSLRFDMGIMYLWEGLDFVPVLVGIFAIPEIIDLAVRYFHCGGRTRGKLTQRRYGRDQRYFSSFLAGLSLLGDRRFCRHHAGGRRWRRAMDGLCSLGSKRQGL
jgi:putative tricarboxylic transport membrane protein